MPDPRHAAERAATFGEVFADPEYRAIFTAATLSTIGDYLARAAVTALIFSITGSVALSALSFAVGYLPVLTCGPLLSAFAERYPNRTVMIVCDLIRAPLIALVAIPHLHAAPVLVLLFLTALLNPPFEASRSALLPRILDGDRYVVAMSTQHSINQAALVVGYFAGGALAPFHPGLALLIDSATFLVSAAIIAARVRPRGVIAPEAPRRRLVPATVAGFRLVFTNPVLRAVAVLVMGGWFFAVVPEGLAAAWASQISHGGSVRGLDQALIMMASPVGCALGALVVGRFVSPATRRRLIRPLAVLSPAALVPAFAVHSVAVIVVLAMISGFAVNGLAAPANGLFVRALPAAFRARAFGVMQFGLQLVQAVALVVTGLIADRYKVPAAVTLWSTIGVLVMLGVGLLWPAPKVIDDTIAAVQEGNRKAAGPAVATDTSATDPGATHVSATGMGEAGAGIPEAVAAMDAAPTGEFDPLGGFRGGEPAVPRQAAVDAAMSAPEPAGAPEGMVADENAAGWNGTRPAGGRHAARPTPRHTTPGPRPSARAAPEAPPAG